MSVTDDIKSWLWVVQYWAIVYILMLGAGITASVLASPSLYWVVSIPTIFLLAAPVTYKHLVGGGCSLKYQICALVKGALVGLIFMLIAIAVDPMVWSTLKSSLGWSALELPVFSDLLYQAWFYAGIVGGFGARIIEVRQMNSIGNITIAGYE